MSGEWLSRNPSLSSRKRDRRSYDNSWSTYEARGNGNGRSSSGAGGIQRFQGGGSSGGAGRIIDRNNITAQGERVGIPHNEIPRVRMVAETAPAGPYGQGGVASGQGSYNNNPYGNNNSKRGNNGSGNSRVRVADYRGSAARVGQLPARDGPHPSIYQADSSYRGGGNSNSNGGGSNNYNIPLFSNPEFLASLKNPPPITVTLPKDFRSTLNDEQTKVVESILSGHSTFFTGPAGSGKSHVLSTLLKANKAGIGGKNGKQRKIVVTATTGVAACNVGGVTIHSFSGVGAGNGSLAELAKRVMGNEYSKDRWREVDILVIDEISMMAGSFLDKLNFVASRARNDRRPFGGVQLVVCGDFFQLPPIDLSKQGFAFEAECWPEVIKCSVLLKQVFRQRGDTTLIDILNEARIGELSRQSVEVLRRHSTLPSAAFGGKLDEDDEEKIIPTLLECKNKEVDKANEHEMNKLEGEIVTYNSRDRAVSDGHQKQLKHCAAPQVLKLKVGAQVMLLKNLDLEKGLANGSRGVVVRFQRPKSQADVHSAFKNMDFPVVKFDAVKAVGKTDDDESESTEVDNEFVINPDDWSNKLGDQTVSSRIQIPLRPAWSISVHKSQGMTIPNLTVNLAGVFEYGQAYVALSRATELKLLTLRGFSEKSFRAHPKVKAFYRVLDGKPPNVGTNKRHINKENVVSHPIDQIGELPDPFEDPRQGNNPYNSSSNPYTQRKHQPGSNPYQQRAYQANGRFSPNPQTSPRPPSSMASASPTLTQEQKQRMEESRKRALAIRMKKQQSS